MTAFTSCLSSVARIFLCSLLFTIGALGSVGIAYKSGLWPKVAGVATVYYVIDSASDPNATPKIQTAINQFNSDFPGLIQWVKWTSSDGPNYVDINLSASDTSGQCEALEGYEAKPAQPMTGSTSCTVGTILHDTYRLDAERNFRQLDSLLQNLNKGDKK